MDRNVIKLPLRSAEKVALRKESVDRNFRYSFRHLQVIESLSARRAWIEISVTRYRPTPKPSLSARRAWIEIRMVLFLVLATMSLSARRAWIEIQ